MTGTDGGWPDRWQPAKGERTARPEVTLLGYGDRVRVTAAGAPHFGEVGTVRRVQLDGGELMHRVSFADGSGDEFYADELRRVNRG